MKVKLQQEQSVPYLVDEDSDDHGALSSDEEQDEMILKQDLPGDEVDDFAKEMDAEIKQSMAVSFNKKRTPQENEKKKKAADKFYDDVYFNSDSESDEERKTEKKVKTNDELFYDPTLDEKDEEWVTKKRKNYLKPGSSSAAGEEGTSATLACPACMTVLCRDCQQHESYHHQFRAMFVFSCLVLKTETLAYELKEKRRKKPAVKGQEELFNPVKCAVCETKVGVFDKEEVYHFFNVLAT